MTPTHESVLAQLQAFQQAMHTAPLDDGRDDGRPQWASVTLRDGKVVDAGDDNGLAIWIHDNASELAFVAGLLIGGAR